MKLTTISLLTLSALVTGTKLQTPSNLARTTIDCKTCIEQYEFCDKHGRTPGQENGCQRTCREHVCHRSPECKDCNDYFKKDCTNRFKNACNGPC